MLTFCRATKVKVFFLVLVYVFKFDVLKFSAAVLERDLLNQQQLEYLHSPKLIQFFSKPNCLCVGLKIRSLLNCIGVAMSLFCFGQYFLV